MGQPQGVRPAHFQLIASYSSDLNRYLGNTYPITTREGGDVHAARVKSYRDVLEEYATHPKPNSAGPNGRPCTRSTRGLITRLHVNAASIYYVGKESNFLGEVESEFLHDLDDVQQNYLDPNQDHGPYMWPEFFEICREPSLHTEWVAARGTFNFFAGTNGEPLGVSVRS